jgi:3',5'-nucleoside bisphosphate phosphatase
LLGKADLHIHTTASDGSCEPAEIVELAKSKSLNTISITDHDTIDGYLKAIEIAEKLAVNLIPGVEITALCDGQEIHILAYSFDHESLDFRTFLKNQRLARLNRMKEILQYLGRHEGIDLTLDEVKAQARSNNVGRPHVAQLLVKKKIVASIAEAFIRYLGTPLIEKIQITYAGIDEVVQSVKDAGGITSLAHPGPLYTMEEVEKFIDFGLDGIECMHPGHSFSDQKKFTEFAENRNLLITGGSDFHGTGREYDPYFGIVTLSEHKVNTLIRMADRRKKLKMKLES